MTRQRIEIELISEKIEGLNIRALEKAYRRYRSTTSTFKNLNVRDPIDYIDFAVNLKNELKEILTQIKCGNYTPRRPQIHYAPKNNGISRPTVTLKIEDAIVYRFCVEQIDKELIEITRQKNIRGGVMASPVPNPDDGEYYEKWFIDWMDHNAAIHNALKTYPYIATTDISSYFDNVEVPVLAELLRETIKNKPNLISLLCFFLENIKLRYGYKTTLNTGLVQDDSDSSRILAYFYLHTHDVTMIDFCNKNDAHFFRYVDDMNVVTRSHTDAKLALRTLTNSLRQLGLMASIEKTTINPSKKALVELFQKENQDISELEYKVKQAINKGEDTTELCVELKAYYDKLKADKYDERKNWIKLLRRFYTIFTYLQCDALLPELKEHLVNFPNLVDTRKIYRYLIANQESSLFTTSVDIVLDYLESDENLYPKVETNLLELLCDLNLTNYSPLLRAEDIAHRLTGGKSRRPLKAQSSYSQGVAFLLLYKCNPDRANEVAGRFIGGKEENEFIKRCMAIVSLTVSNTRKCEEVKHKLRMETGTEMKRLLNLIENMDIYKGKNPFKKYIENSQFYLYTDKYQGKNGKDVTKQITIEYHPVRTQLLNQLCVIHG